MTLTAFALIVFTAAGILLTVFLFQSGKSFNPR